MRRRPARATHRLLASVAGAGLILLGDGAAHTARLLHARIERDGRVLRLASRREKSIPTRADEERAAVGW